MDVVKEYSQCLLTEASDKLTAVAAVAKFYQDEHGKTYAAGLWREDMPLALCCFVSTRILEIRPAAYRAPTWSWAAVDGKVTEKPIPGYESKVETLELVTVPGSDIAPLASVVSGSLTIRAEMVSAVSQIKVYGGKGEFFADGSIISIEEPAGKQTRLTCAYAPLTTQSVIDVKLDALEDSWANSSSVQLDVWLMMIAGEDYTEDDSGLTGVVRHKYVGLVLREALDEGQEVVYQRIGLFSDHPFHGSFWETAFTPLKPETRTVTIL
jgi:hypothetical protein